MKLLIVEDDATIIDALTEDLTGILQPGEIVVCRSRDEALAAIGLNTFDYAILDLKIPTVNSQLDSDVHHGWAVYEKLRADSRGTPICILTGYATEDLFSDILQHAELVDVWGGGTSSPIVILRRKGRLHEIQGLVEGIKTQINVTDNIEIIAEPLPPFPENRILRIYGRRKGGASLVANKLSGGLSGVRVLRVKIRDQNGVERLTVAARVGNRSDVLKEIENYHRDVIRLPNGSYSVHTGDVFAGAGASCGVFYRLIPDFESLSAIIKQDPARAADVVQRLQTIETAWTQGHPQSASSIADIRRRLVPDAKIAEVQELLQGIAWEEFEQHTIQVIFSCQHGDLHADNVLVRPNGDPVLIDYAEVGTNPASLDPLSLELSPLFHPTNKVASSTWPTAVHIANWTDLNRFVEGSPIEPFIRATRSWAVEVAAGNRERYAVAYSYAVRQLRYVDTDKSFAQGIIRAVIAAYG
jgi:CheY-like chemotaxis protein